MAALQRHLDDVLESAGFMHSRNASQLRQRLARLLARAMPDEKEVRILRGMLAAIERRWTEPLE
jgi:tRNA C32,U32 (ribose-2'-O)-methylase TrmJ